MPDKPRIAVVSPFLDKRHGTERCVAEQVERLEREFGYEIHIYSRWMEDVSQDGRGRIVWHRVPPMLGPGLVKYVWWFLANHLWRWWDERIRGMRYDLVYSPGINCVGADAISVHIVFAEFRERVRRELAFRRNSLATWPRILHRRLYYRLIVTLERMIYPRKDVALCAISRKTARDLARFYGRNGDVRVVYYGVDAEQFSPIARARHRQQARSELELSERAFCLLLVGNDWRKKGLLSLLDTVKRLEDARLRVLVVGKDDRTPFEAEARAFGLAGRVHFLPIRPDVEFYYAAADAYVGPSLEDAFALPPLEAMACGLPVIVSSQAGVSEIVSDGVDGLILRDPRDPKELAGLIRGLVEDADLRRRLGEQAVQTAQKYTWDRNAAGTAAFLENAMRGRRRP